MAHDINYRRDNGRKKRTGVVSALLALTFGLCMAAPTVRAEERQMAGPEQAFAMPPEYPATWEGLSSRGSLVYQETEKSAQICAADFLLLQNRLDTICDTIFEPACYTHSHQWEYLDINKETHARHCNLCGNEFDLSSAHKAERKESCSLSHDGAEYPGMRYTCVCGYQWEQEESHALFFESVSKTSHKSGCRLNGTGFCPGYEPITEEHYAYYYNPCSDGRHHEKVCMDCGYQIAEECYFSLTDTDGVENCDNGENGSGDGSNGDSEMRRCWCGNAEKQNTEPEEDAAYTESKDDPSSTKTSSDNAPPEIGEISSGTETEEKKPDAEPKREETLGAETKDDNTDTKQGGGYEE